MMHVNGRRKKTYTYDARPYGCADGSGRERNSQLWPVNNAYARHAGTLTETASDIP
jgi:hypothetical protein